MLRVFLLGLAVLLLGMVAIRQQSQARNAKPTLPNRPASLESSLSTSPTVPPPTYDEEYIDASNSPTAGSSSQTRTVGGFRVNQPLGVGRLVPGGVNKPAVGFVPQVINGKPAKPIFC